MDKKLSRTTLIVLAILATACAPYRGATGPAGSQGHPGRDGADGSPGLNGQDGAAGSVGATGPAGQDGQIAHIIQLCPGVTTYPTVFVEVALCINNQLYGVYSANGGFLTALPPGTYSSSAIGSACTVTVLPNCLLGGN